MSKITEITELLEGKFFKYREKDYFFKSCKKVNFKIMILTDSEVIQIVESDVETFFEAVAGSVSNKGTVGNSKGVQIATPNGLIMPESANMFKALNESFAAILSSLDGDGTEDLERIGEKAKILTSIAQSAINMQNSNIEIYKAINK